MDIIFVSTAESLQDTSIKELEKYCKDIIVKKNVGYDFGAWKTGLDYLGTKLQDYEQLILCNDSVYGPFFNLETIFEKMNTEDFWSMTDNHEIEYHLQSYFIVYSKKVFTHKTFVNFWTKFKIYHDKQTLIEKNEIDFSQALMNENFTYSAYYSSKDKNYVNILQYGWNDLLTQHQFPFIKRELLKRNPLGIDIKNWSEIITSVSTYDTKLITKDL